MLELTDIHIFERLMRLHNQLTKHWRNDRITSWNLKKDNQIFTSDISICEEFMCNTSEMQPAYMSYILTMHCQHIK